MKPSVFIGSSSEGLDVARAVEEQLYKDAEITVWKDGFFKPGSGYLETLVNSLDRFDFAILIVTGDDLVTSREVTQPAPRDNIMFELGLFMGRLGRSRVFAMRDKSQSIRLPSDLSGISIPGYDGNRINDSPLSAVSPACNSIRRIIRDLGIFEGRNLQHLQDATAHVENASIKMERLIHLLARSRVVELEITASQFAAFIPQDFLKQMLQDLKDLERETRERDSD